MEICSCEIKKFIERVVKKVIGESKMEWTKQMLSIVTTIEEEIKELDLSGELALNIEIIYHSIIPENSTLTIIILNKRHKNIMKATITNSKKLDMILYNYSFLSDTVLPPTIYSIVV